MDWSFPYPYPEHANTPNLSFKRDENIKSVSFFLSVISPERAKITHASNRNLKFALLEVKHSFD